MIKNAAEKESLGKSYNLHTGSLLTIKPAGNQKTVSNVSFETVLFVEKPGCAIQEATGFLAYSE